MKAAMKAAAVGVVILALSGPVLAREHDPVDADSPALHCDGSVWAPFCDVSYDRASCSMWICFACGCEYVYPGVPARSFSEFAHSPVKGAFFNRHIRPRFPGRRLQRAERAARNGDADTAAQEPAKEG